MLTVCRKTSIIYLTVTTEKVGNVERETLLYPQVQRYFFPFGPQVFTSVSGVLLPCFSTDPSINLGVTRQEPQSFVFPGARITNRNTLFLLLAFPSIYSVPKLGPHDFVS